MRIHVREPAIIALALITVIASTRTTAADLTAGGTFGAGLLPIAIATGDFNRDGKADLAVVNQQSEDVSILIANGDGTFQTATNYPVGHFPQNIAVGDLNRDGKLDLVVANQFDPGFVSVLLGNGDGTFQAAVPYDTASTDPSSVAIGDFNRDGTPDLVAANYTDPGSISILLGNGDGTFMPAVTNVCGRNPLSVTAADFNGDGKLDIVVANDIFGSPSSPASVTVLLGNGNGTFKAPVNYRTGRNPGSIAVGDFNNDGKLDLVTANHAAVGSVSVLLGHGDGTFDPALGYPTGPNPVAVVAVDCDRDRQLDLAVVDDNGVSLLLGYTDGSFASPDVYTVGTGPIALSVGDFNSDRRPDLAVADNNDDNVALLLNSSPAVELWIERTNNTATVSWLYPSTGYFLESKTNVVSPMWQLVTEATNIHNGFWEVTVPVVPGKARFFRLHQQQ